MSTRSSSRKRKQAPSSPAVDATPPRKSREIDTPDWLSDLDIHLSPKASAASRNMSSVRKASPSKRTRSPYVFGSSSQSGESDASPQKIAPKSFYGSKTKKTGYLTPLERKEMREKMNSSAEGEEATVKSGGSSPRKKPIIQKPKRQKGNKVNRSKSKVTKKIKKAAATKVPSKPSQQRTPKKAKTPKEKLPKKSPRRSVPRNKSPLKPIVAKKGISLYLHSKGQGKAQAAEGKSATKLKKVVKEEVTKKTSTPRKSTPRKSTSRKSTPKKSVEDTEESDMPIALRGLDFGDTMDEVENEVSNIQQRIQDLIDTSLEDSDDITDSPRSPRKRRMKTKEQSLVADERYHPKRPRLLLSSSSRTPTPSKSPRKSPKKASTPTATSTPRQNTSAAAASPLARRSPAKLGTPSRGARSPARSLLGRSPAAVKKSLQPDTPESSSVGSQDKPVNTLSKTKEQNRMFPVYTPPTSPELRSTPKSASKRRSILRKLTDKDGKEQLTLDVGQKKFGTTICKTCSMVYTLAHPEDEANHAKFHKKYLSYIKFPGWKNETVLHEFHDGRILLVTSEAPKYALKKIEEVRELVDHELGFLEGSSIANKDTLKTLLFVTLDKRVAGCLIAEEITKGYRVIPDDDPRSGSSPGSQEEIREKEQQRAWCCQTKPERAVCGISRIWVTASMRRKNIGKRLMDCVRNNFIYGSIMTMDDIAFSDPTPDGKGFATQYTGTPSFLVYKYKS